MLRLYTKSSSMVQWQIMKLKDLREKDTVPGSQGIPYGSGWDQTHVCMVTEHLNDKFVFL